MIDDEIQLEDDPRGEAKIDADGNLLDGTALRLHSTRRKHSLAHSLL